MLSCATTFQLLHIFFISVGQLQPSILQDYLNPGWDQQHHHNGDIDDDDYDEGKPRAESGFTQLGLSFTTRGPCTLCFHW